MSQRKISSVLELARYQVGDSAWWVTIRFKDILPKITEDNEWMINDVHPKVLYERGGPFRSNWPYRSILPRLQHDDFSGLVGLLISELVVERFDICDIIRSNNTGEFYYSNSEDEWMPESYLFDTDVAARRERSRITKLIGKWASSQK